MYYSKKIKMPKTIKEGICNFVQLIINNAEAEKSREAMYIAVDLLDDLHNGVYDIPKTNEIDKESNLNKRLIKMEAETEVFANSEYIRGLTKGKKQIQDEIKSILDIK